MSEFDKSVKFRLSESIQYADGAVVSKQVLKKKTGNITLFAFDSGEGLSEHTAPFDATVMIIDGKARITIDGEVSILATGEGVVMPANVPHALHAEERFKMILTMIREG